MMRRSIPALVVSAAAVIGLVLGTAAPADAHPHPSSTVHANITANGDLHIRHAIPAGFLKFDVDGAAGHALQLVQPKQHASPARVVDDLKALNATGKGTRFEHDFTAIGGSSTETDLWVRLHHGTYYAFDSSSPKITAKQIVVLHVGGGTVVAHRPHVGAVITAVGEMSWAKRPTHIPARGVLAFLNEATDYHFIVLQQLKRGTTLAELKKALASTDQSKQPDFVLAGSYSTGILSPSHAQLSTYKLPKGLYALMCFWPDEHGVPHAVMGMVRLIRVG